MAIFNSSDIRKYIVQLLGIVLVIGGLSLIKTGSKIEGTTVIKFTYNDFGSELTTSQTGVILLFMGVILVLIPAIRFKPPTFKSPNEIITKSVIAVLLLIIYAAIIICMSYFNVRSLFIALIGGGMGFLVLLILIALFDKEDS